MTAKTFLTASAFAMMLPFAATAATVSGTFSDTEVNELSGEGRVGFGDITDLEGGGSVSFDFSADPAANVSGVGTVRRDDTVEGLVISFGGAVLETTSGPDNSLSFGFGPFGLFAGDVVSLEFAWTGAEEFDNIDFDIELAPIPVPAAGLMLLSVLGGGAFAARRKKKANA